jgi:hypothetical protein
MDTATQIYNQILKNGEEGLDAMILEQRQESQYLDFKTASKQAAPLEHEDRKNFAKTAGSFANSDGGVIVWGVKTAPNAGFDTASKLEPIAKVEIFKTELENQLSQMLQPCPKIEHSIIQSPSCPDAGYVITCVPYYDGLPIRSITRGGSDFHIRVGDRSMPMPTGILADRFGRRPLPKLRVVGIFQLENDNRDFRLSVVNTGRGIAKLIAVTIPNVPNWPSPGISWSHASGVGKADQPFVHQGTCYEAPSEVYIHSNRSKEFLWSFKVNDEFMSAVKSGIKIPYNVACDGFEHGGVLISKPDADGFKRWLLTDD